MSVEAVKMVVMWVTSGTSEEQGLGRAKQSPNPVQGEKGVELSACLEKNHTSLLGSLQEVNQIQSPLSVSQKGHRHVERPDLYLACA